MTGKPHPGFLPCGFTPGGEAGILVAFSDLGQMVFAIG